MTDSRMDRTVKGRETETRERQVRQWQPASILPDPTPEPGKVFRWLRASLLGQPDPTNMSGKLREGWEPVKVEDHPELMLGGNQSGNVEIGGLVLSKNDEETMAQRDAYYHKQAKAQMDSVDNTYFRENNPRMPLFKEHRSETSRGNFGSGSSKS